MYDGKGNVVLESHYKVDEIKNVDDSVNKVMQKTEFN